MASKRNLNESTSGFWIPLLALLLVAAPSLSQASSDVTRRVNEKYANSYTLHFISGKRSGTTHSYSFGGYLNYANGTAERVGMDVKGTYYGSSALAVEVVSFNGSLGSYSATTKWGCTDDPWLSAQAKCSQERASPSGSAPTYLWAFCPDSLEGHYCFASNNMVPKAMVKLMRDGLSAPSVSGVEFTHHAPVKVTLHYAANSADHFYVDEWYCPPGKDEAPNYIPNGDSESFPGGACQDSKRGPLGLTHSASTASFGIGDPAGQPKNGTWYVRASLDSASYGRSLWGRWHKTAVQLPMHFKDAPNNKPAPTVLAPKDGYVWIGSDPGEQLAIKLKSNIAGKEPSSWSYDFELQRQRYVTKANAEAYRKLHKGGFPSQSGALEAMHPWLSQRNINLGSMQYGHDWQRSLSYQEMRPESVEFSYRYRFRARDNGSKWSPWRYLIVAEAPPPSTGMRRSASALESMPTQPPDIAAPTEDQVFAEAIGAQKHFTPIEIHSNIANPKPDHWRLQWEWRRARYYTKSNNDMYYCEYGEPKKGQFPRQTGVVPPLQTWEAYGVTPFSSNVYPHHYKMMKFDIDSTAPHSTLFSYLVQFRVRVQRISPEAYGPWSPWRSFIVENTGFNKCTSVSAESKPHLGGIGIRVPGQTQQQSGQHSQQRALGPSNVRIGSAVPHAPALHQQAPPMHTMSGRLNSPKTPVRHARVGLAAPRISARRAPDLRVLNHVGTVDPSCANLARFITIRETVTNEGGPLAAGRAKLYVKETGGAHIGSAAVPVPALAHGGVTTLTIRAGTREPYRGKVPGRHVLPVFVVVNGKATTTNVVEALRPGACQVRRRALHVPAVRQGVKLNPQPEPPSAPRRLAIPHR